MDLLRVDRWSHKSLPGVARAAGRALLLATSAVAGATPTAAPPTAPADSSPKTVVIEYVKAPPTWASPFVGFAYEADSEGLLLTKLTSFSIPLTPRLESGTCTSGPPPSTVTLPVRRSGQLQLDLVVDAPLKAELQRWLAQDAGFVRPQRIHRALEALAADSELLLKGLFGRPLAQPVRYELHVQTSNCLRKVQFEATPQLSGRPPQQTLRVPMVYDIEALRDKQGAGPLLRSLTNLLAHESVHLLQYEPYRRPGNTTPMPAPDISYVTNLHKVKAHEQQAYLVQHCARKVLLPLDADESFDLNLLQGRPDLHEKREDLSIQARMLADAFRRVPAEQRRSFYIGHEVKDALAALPFCVAQARGLEPTATPPVPAVLRQLARKRVTERRFRNVLYESPIPLDKLVVRAAASQASTMPSPAAESSPTAPASDAGQRP
jgi:hypothetical protein